ncbi:hypothetical protein Tco_0726652 [Tanacetum coccineum]|uniref:Reverse transcriptase domain-containing protein n=1 Tax=Tanacetum coccineum TaxID=301880 RepID=A0ABQ4YIG2_9ASTR
MSSININGAENLAADHLSRLEIPELGKLTKAEIRDLFLEEQLMMISDKNNEPWNEAAQIIHQCHRGPSGGHHGITTTARNVFEARSTSLISFVIHKNWSNLVMHVSELATFPRGMRHLKSTFRWVEAHAFYTSNAQNMVNFLKKLFARFAGENRFLQINELDELRLDAYESSISYKEKTKRWHEKWIKTPTVYEKGEKVLLFNSRLRLFPSKLKSRWYMPFTISRDMKGGAIELCNEEGNEFIVNKQHVKSYQKDISEFDADDDITLDDGGVT